MDEFQALQKAIELIGNQSTLAKRLDPPRTAQAVQQWKRVPSDDVIRVSELTSYRVTPNALRRDLYPHPDDGLPDALRGGGAEKLSAALDLLKPEEAEAVAAAIVAGPAIAARTIEALDVEFSVRSRLLDAAKRASDRPMPEASA